MPSPIPMNNPLLVASARTPALMRYCPPLPTPSRSTLEWWLLSPSLVQLAQPEARCSFAGLGPSSCTKWFKATDVFHSVQSVNKQKVKQSWADADKKGYTAFQTALTKYASNYYSESLALCRHADVDTYRSGGRMPGSRCIRREH